MEVSKKSHKAMLLSLFFIRDGFGQIQERRFPLDELVAASSCMRILKENGKINEETGVVSFEDGPIEFGKSEERVLSKLVEGVKDATATEASDLFELKEMLK